MVKKNYDNVKLFWRNVMDRQTNGQNCYINIARHINSVGSQANVAPRLIAWCCHPPNVSARFHALRQLIYPASVVTIDVTTATATNTR